MTLGKTLKTMLVAAMALCCAVPAFSKSYSMDDYLSLVLKNNKDLKIATLELKNAGEQEKLAKSQALPQIGFQSSMYRNMADTKQNTAIKSRYSDGTFVHKYVDVTKDWDFSFGIGLSQTLFNANVINAIKASKEYKAMSKSEYDAQNDAIITVAKKVFFQCYLLDELYNIRKQTEEQSRRHYVLVKQKYKTGVVSMLEFLNAEVDYKMSIPETTDAKMNLDLCLINLKSLAGIPEDEEVSVIGDFTVYPEIPQMLTMQDVADSRSDYKALLREKSLREINVKANKANHAPTFTLDAAYNYANSDDDFSEAFQNLDYTRVFKVGLKIELPIFNGGALIAKDNQARIEADQTELRLQKKRDDMISELHQIYLTLQREFENIELAEKTVETAQQAYDIALVSFTNGMMTQLELKDTRIKLENAKLNHISSVYSYLSAYFDWQKATSNMDA